MTNYRYQAHVIIAGGGLAGIVTALELLDRNRKVILLERDRRENLGGLCKKAFGGIMFVDTPQQRKLGIRDTPELAWADWQRRAHFQDNDKWPRAWAQTYVEQSREMIYDWLVNHSISFMPMVNWPERGLIVPGNTVPRWHIVWGTGHAIIEALVAHLDNHPRRQHLEIYFDHRVEHLVDTQGRITGCSGVHKSTGEPFEAAVDAITTASAAANAGATRHISRTRGRKGTERKGRSNS